MIARLKKTYLALITFDNETPQVLDIITAALNGSPRTGARDRLRLRALLAAPGRTRHRCSRNRRQPRDRSHEQKRRSELDAARRVPGFGAARPGNADVARHRAFPPGELLEFLDRWLDQLEDGGELVVATPLMSVHFYDDFDHVKP